MDNKNNTEIKLSDEMVAKLDNLSKVAERTLSEMNIPKIVLSDNLLNCLKPTSKIINDSLETMKPIFESIEKAQKQAVESENKRKKNFYHTRKEMPCKYGKRHWSEFKEWYRVCVMFNPTYNNYYDLTIGHLIHTTDENTRYTDPETNTTIKLIGVNSVAYVLFHEYKEKCHNAQWQGLKWTYEEEKKRIEKFIKDVEVEQPVQLQDADESVQAKVIKAFDDREARKFFNNRDFITFTDALATHLSGEEYILPQPIAIRWGGVKRISKAVYDAYNSTQSLRHFYGPLASDTKLFDLMKVLSFFEKKSNEDIARDMQRTDG